MSRCQDNGLPPAIRRCVDRNTDCGDLIACEVSLPPRREHARSVADNHNGTYGAAVAVHLNTTWGSGMGSTTRKMLRPPDHDHAHDLTVAGIFRHFLPSLEGSCDLNSLDPRFGQLRDAVNSPNPTTGSNKTPAANGELVIAAVGPGDAGTPTSGANYTLIDGPL